MSRLFELRRTQKTSSEYAVGGTVCPDCPQEIKQPLARQKMYRHLIDKHNWTHLDAEAAARQVPLPQVQKQANYCIACGKVADTLDEDHSTPGHELVDATKMAGRLCNCNRSPRAHHHCQKHDLMIFTRSAKCPKCDAEVQSKFSGIINPRPAMRRGEERRVHETLKRHKELMDKYVAEGMAPEAASQKAYAEIKKDRTIKRMVKDLGPVKFTGAAKPKCPHCGSSDYSLMPSDFETAKCNKCEKNWNHGIVEGVNDPKTARKPMHDDSGAQTGLRRQPDYGESDSYTSEMNEENEKTAGPLRNTLLPAALGLGMALSPTPSAKGNFTQQQIEQQQKEKQQAEEKAQEEQGPQPISQEDVSAALADASKETKVPLNLLKAIAQIESSYGYDPGGNDRTSAMGLMQMTKGALDQVNKEYGTDYTMDDMNDPQQSALAGAQYMAIFFRRFHKNPDAAIAAYYVGPKHVHNVLSEYGKVTPETLEAAGHDAAANYLQTAWHNMKKKSSWLTLPAKTAGPLGNDPNPDGPSSFFEEVRDPHSERVKTQQSIDRTYTTIDMPQIPVGASAKKTADQVYEDSGVGAVQALSNMSDFNTNGARTRPDPSVRGVWEVKLPSGERVVVYLAGYPDPFGKTRVENDFEVDDSLVTASWVRLASAKTAGGVEFYTVGQGSDIAKAFEHARNQARGEYRQDHDGEEPQGYSGTVLEKHGYRLLTPPKGIKPGHWAQMIMDAMTGDEINPEPLTYEKKMPYKEGMKCPGTKIYQGAGKPILPKCTGTISLAKGHPVCSNPTHNLSYTGERNKDGKTFTYYYSKTEKIKDEAIANEARRQARTVQDKFGPAGAVQVAPNKWAFFGIASS